jgi:translocator protein
VSQLAPALSPRSLLLLVAAAVPVIAVSTLGSVFTFQGLANWYPTLKKPFFTPPNAVFPIVWTFLYTLMALSLWRVLRAQGEGKTRALVLFGLQLALNLAWSWVFFTLRSPIGAIVVIAPLIVMIALTIRAFRPLDAAAAHALIPYLAWVSFASLLNAGIAILN